MSEYTEITEPDAEEDQTWDPDKIRNKINTALTDIERMWPLLEIEALYRYADSRDWPGGEPVALLAPVTNLEAWNHKYDRAEQAGFTSRKGDNYATDQSDDLNVLLTLATLEDEIRDQRDQPTDLRATVPRATSYIRASVEWMLSDDGTGSIRFINIEKLLSILKQVRSRLENVLHDGIRHDQGVPCMKCGTTLNKVWGDQAVDDRWLCRTCSRWSTPAEYNLAVAENYRRNAAALTASDIEDEYRIKPGTLRKWVHEGKVDRRGWDGSGRQLYDVEQAKALRGEPKEETA